MLNPATPQSA
uniref:Uncharacterized protein n=1 Tax=Arundo donax TaxID=35708 RepID=A0A0A8Y864_ARUDO